MRAFEDLASDARPLSAFRIVFYLAVAAHFAPLVIAPSSFLTDEWNGALHSAMTSSDALTLLAKAVAVVGWFIGISGLSSRLGALLTGAATYALTCRNSFDVQSLILPLFWAMFWIWTIGGTGDEHYRLYRRGQVEQPRWVSTMFLIELGAILLFSGLEKLRSGWLSGDPLAVLFRYPERTLTRSTILSDAPAWVTSSASVATVIIEIGLPFLLLFPGRARHTAGVVGVVFVSLLFAMLQIPIAFWLLAAGGLACLTLFEPMATLIAARPPSIHRHLQRFLRDGRSERRRPT